MSRLKSSRARTVRLTLIALLAAVPIAWLTWTVYAATRTWDGGSALNSNWTTPENWNPNATPTPGDDLIFATTARSPSSNNFTSGTTFNTLTVRNAHRVTGNGLALNGGLTAGNATIDLASIRLNNSQTFTAETAGGTANISSTIDFTPAVNSLIIQGPGNFNFTGAMNAGGFVQNGTGITTLTGAAATLSTTSVWDGTLQLGKTGGSLGVGQVLSIGDGTGASSSATARMLASNQTQNNIFISSDGLYDLNGFINSTTELTVNGGSVTIGAGTLTSAITFMTGGTISSTGVGKLVLQGGVTTNAASGTGVINSNVDLGGQTRTFSVARGSFPGSDLNVSGVISNGSVTKTGTGILMFSGANTYSGPTTINTGLFGVLGNQPASAITLNGGTIAGTGTVGSITAGAGTISPAAYLIGAAGAFPQNYGALNVQGNVTFNSSTTYVARFSLNSDQLNVAGGVNLGGSSLVVTLTNGAPTGMTSVIINNDGSDAVVGQFAGLAEGAPIGSVPGVHISYRGGDGGNDVVLYTPTTTRVWTGGGGDNKWSTQANWEGGVVPRASDSLEFPSSGAQKTNVNDLTAGLALNAINFSGSGYNITGNSVNLAGGISGATAQIGLARITLNATQTFSGSFTVASEVEVNGKLLDISAGVTISGAMSGTGEIRKTESVGTATLSGNNHNFTGATTIPFDPLAINGLHDQSPVTLSNVGTLAGSGTTGPVTATGASIRPSGILSVNGNLSVGSSRVDLQACKLEYSIVSPK